MTTLTRTLAILAAAALVALVAGGAYAEANRAPDQP